MQQLHHLAYLLLILTSLATNCEPAAATNAAPSTLASGESGASHAQAATPSTIEDALARASELESDLQFAQVIEVLDEYSGSGNADIEFRLANAYMNVAINGRQQEQIELADIQPAIDLARRAAEHGSSAAYNLLYMIYGNGWGVAEDHRRAADYLREAVSIGDSGAKLNYAILLYRGSHIVDRNRERSCPLFMELAQQPAVQAIAAYYYGLLVYHGGCGDEPDPDGGMQLIASAAKQDFHLAQRDMAKNLEFGWTGATDLQIALEWYQKAADRGDPYSQWRIGMSYVRGEFRDPDTSRAVTYFQLSADSEDLNGLVSLAVMYATGDGIELDYSKARALYEKAALLGGAHAYQGLAKMYYNGEGLEVDRVYARLLYLQSVALGSSAQPKFEAMLDKNMSAEQIEQSDRQFQRWKAMQPSTP